MIKSFLDSDEELNDKEVQKLPELNSIFGSAADSNARPIGQTNDDLDPFAASDAFPLESIDRQETDTREPDILRNESPHSPPNVFDQEKYEPPTTEESARMSGLALTAGIAFVSSVVFMLVLGWLVDTFIGTTPWGIVGGIVVGSLIGFIQFFRLNSQILNTPGSHRPSSLMDLAGTSEEPASPADHAEPPPSAEDLPESSENQTPSL
jgi:F0F1-type ATP synthase assembly protein I